MLAASSPATGDPIHFNSSHRIFIEQQGSYYGIGLSGKMRVYDVFLRSSKGLQSKRCSINVWLQRSVREMQLGSKQCKCCQSQPILQSVCCLQPLLLSTMSGPTGDVYDVPGQRRRGFLHKVRICKRTLQYIYTPVGS